jgi:RNA polymerase sigma factor (TIGR02999 family)
MKRQATALRAAPDLPPQNVIVHPFRKPSAPEPTVHTRSSSVDDRFSEVYERLKHLASRQLSAASGHTLDTTALVHELYLRLERSHELLFDTPGQFFSYAGRAMRHILLDRARDRLRQKAGGDWIKVTITATDGPAIDSAEQAIALDDALSRLEKLDARAARVVELRWFAGMTPDQIADVLNMTRRTVDRDWQYARAFLHAVL